MKKADLILSADLHIRETTPECRTDDFDAALWNKIAFIGALAEEHECPILIAGDVFHHWKPSPNLIRMCIERFPVGMHVLFGQHDLPQHSWQNREKSGLAALEAARAVKILPGCHWGQDPGDPSYTINWFEGKIHEGLKETQRQILVWHHMVWQGKRPWPGCTDPSAVAVLKKYPEYDLILTGDNHKPFTEEYEGRLLVNPGSITRQSADQIDHTPRVYLYYASTNTVRPVFLPVQEGKEVISRDHIDRKEERTERISTFISRLGGEWEAGLSFEENLKRFFESNKVLDSVKQIVWDAVDGDNKT